MKDLVFALSALKVLKETIAQIICLENFHDLSKIRENRKIFSCLTFVGYGICM